jgi:DNA-binding transcriptional regulator YiaG
MKKIIESPFADAKAMLQIKPNKMIFRKEEFDVYDYYYICQKTEKEFSTDEAGDVTLKQLYNQYREKHNVMFPVEIKELREKYDLSAAKMSEVLGFGTNIYRNYENGEIPNKSNANILELAKDTDIFLKLAHESSALSEIELDEFKKKAAKNFDIPEEEIIKKCFRIYSNEINQFTGYIQKQLYKIANMVLFFLTINDRTYKTRLNKYLFYSDFLCYKYKGTAMSGFNYVAIDKGPVPDSYEMLYDVLEKEGYIRSEEIEYKDKEISKLVPLKSFDISNFDEEEMEILKLVIDTLQYKKTQDIIDESHKIKAWEDNIANKSTISYQKYAWEVEV